MSRRRLSAEGVRRLTDPRCRRYLGPFLGRETTVAAAAEELSVSVAAMWQQVQRLVAAGLLVETRRTPRRGRPVRHYRSSEISFDIPLAQMPHESLEQLMDAGDARSGRVLRDSLIAAFLRSTIDPRQLVLRIQRLPNGAVDASPALLGGDAVDAVRGVWSSWTYLRLDDNEFDQLRGELAELWTRWTLREPPRDHCGATTAVLRLAMAPTNTQP